MAVGASPVEDAPGRAASTVLKRLNYLKLWQERIGRPTLTPHFSNVRPRHSRVIVCTVTKNHQSGDVGWDRGREAYLDLPQKPVYAPVAKPAHKVKGQGGGTPLISISTQERLGSLIAAGGIVWGVYIATQNFAGIWSFDLVRQGPMEVAALGILIWLHAKWRRSTKVS